MEKKLLSLIIPVYNEENSIYEFISYLVNKFDKSEILLKFKIEIIVIDDGSNDNTKKILYDLKKKYYEIKIIIFSKNFGKEAALTAGIDLCSGDIVVPIDVDFQDDPDIIFDLVKKYEDGFDMVLAQRIVRNEFLIKKILSNFFYILFNLLSDQKIPNNVGDFRLISKKVINSIKLYREKNRFMKGIFSNVGFKTTTVPYIRNERKIGTPKQSFKKLFQLGFDAILNYSTVPLKIIFILGIIISAMSFSFGIYIGFKKILYNIDTPGWTTIICTLTFLSGIQMLSIGVIGMYISKIYLESKNRPIYIISEKNGF